MRRRWPSWIAALLVTLVVAACGSDQSADEAPAAEPPPVVVNADVTVHRIDYPTRGPRDPGQNWGDFYLPAGPQRIDSIPLVVLIHGGSWKSQFDAHTMSAYAMDLARRGMAVYNIEYRRLGSGGGWPTTFTDVADALDYVVEIDKRFPQITTDDELVVGHSAGAQLAVWAGTRNTLRPNEVGSRPKFRPTRVVALAGPLDMTYAATHGNDRIVTVLGGTPDQVPGRYHSVDPIQNIDPTMPVIAIHGDQDTLVPMELSRRYIDAVDRRGGVGGLIIARGEGHVSIVDPRSRSYRRILDIITDVSKKSVRQLASDYRG
jgi:acetyl esterase/lipase